MMLCSFNNSICADCKYSVCVVIVGKWSEMKLSQAEDRDRAFFNEEASRNV